MREIADEPDADHRRACRRTRWICRATRTSSPRLRQDPRFEAGTLDRGDPQAGSGVLVVHVAAVPLRRRSSATRDGILERAKQNCVVRRSSAAGSGPRRHVQSLQADLQLRSEGRQERRHRRPAAALQPARAAGHVAALGRQQQPGRGAQQERGDRRRRDRGLARPRRRWTASRKWALDLKPPAFPPARIDQQQGRQGRRRSIRRRARGATRSAARRSGR